MNISANKYSSVPGPLMSPAVAVCWWLWANLTFWPPMTFALGIWPLTAWTYIIKSHNTPINQVWFHSNFNFSYFSLSYNFTSDDLWPWYVIFDLIIKCGFPCCIYNPMVEIHQSMWKFKAIINPFSQCHQQTTGNNRARSGPNCVSC